MPDKGTEQATPQRKKKAREQGDIVHSRELLSAMAMLGGVMMLGTLSHGFVANWNKAYVESLRSAMTGVRGVDEQSGEQLLNGAVRRILVPALLPVGLVMAAALATEVTIAMVARLSPQLPAMVVSIPLKTMVSYVVLIGSLAMWPGWIERHFTALLDAAAKLMVRA